MHDSSVGPPDRGTEHLRRWTPSSRTRLVLLTLGLIALVVAAVGIVARYRSPGRGWDIGISAFSPYLLLGAPVAVFLLLAARHWWAGTLAAIIVAGCVAIQLPLFVASTAPADARTLVTMTANLRLGQAHAESLVAAVRRHHVEALMLQELTPAAQQHLVAAGLGRLLPFHASEPRPYAYGTGLWSRYPLSDISLRHDFTCSFVTANVTVPGLHHAVTLAAVHMAGPWPKSVHWQYDMRRLPQALRELTQRNRTVLVGGDFNATPDVKQFRQLLTHGYHDAADQAGAGLTRTYPSNRWFPPLIAIDHVLTRNATATRVSTLEIPGTDHRALLVVVQLAEAE